MRQSTWSGLLAGLLLAPTAHAQQAAVMEAPPPEIAHQFLLRRAVPVANQVVLIRIECRKAAGRG